MKRFIYKAGRWVNRRMFHYFGLKAIGKPTLAGYFELKRDLRQWRGAVAAKGLREDEFPVTRLYPCYGDKSDSAGSLPYVGDLHIAQRIFRNQPRRHIDIGSSIGGFAAYVAAFRTIDIFDIRPLDHAIPNMVFTQMDLMSLAPEYERCTDSISSLSVLEHFGLGRYGDPICYEGHLLGFDNITRMLDRGGTFYFSVPLGPQRIEFHAHRIFSMPYLLDWVGRDYDIVAFSYVDDRGDFHENVAITPEFVADNFGCRFGHAFFELTKR